MWLMLALHAAVVYVSAVCGNANLSPSCPVQAMPSSWGFAARSLCTHIQNTNHQFSLTHSFCAASKPCCWATPAIPCYPAGSHQIAMSLSCSVIQCGGLPEPRLTAVTCVAIPNAIHRANLGTLSSRLSCCGAHSPLKASQGGAAAAATAHLQARVWQQQWCHLKPVAGIECDTQTRWFSVCCMGHAKGMLCCVAVV